MMVWIAVVALVVATVAAYPGLPDTIPMNLDVNGAAKRFAAKTPFNWGLPIIIAVSVIALLDVIASAMPGRAHLINFPGKEQLLALPKEYQTEAISMTQRFMDVMNLFLVVTFASVQWSMWRSAHGSPSSTMSALLVVFGIVPIFLVGFFVLRLQNAVDEAQRRYDSRRNPLKA